MNNPQELEQIREFFAKDRFATDNGATIEEVDDGFAKCSLEITPPPECSQYCHGRSHLHPGRFCLCSCIQLE